MSCVDAQLVLSELYETEFGIYNHLGDESKRPLAAVGYNESENIGCNLLLEKAIRTYIRENIKDVYGLNFLEFIELPSDIINTLCSCSAEEMRRKSELLNNTLLENKFK